MRKNFFLRPQEEVLLAADCGSLELESWKPQELLCGCMIRAQELLCGRTRNFLRLLADRILNSLRLELLAEKAQFNFFLPLACSCGARTSCATSCARSALFLGCTVELF